MSKLAFAKLEGKATIDAAADFLAASIEAVPDQIHTVLTDNGMQFCDQPIPRCLRSPRLQFPALPYVVSPGPRHDRSG